MTGRLIFADQTVFDGQWIGAEEPVAGEVVFNTSMTGYQEILTDPSYYGQLVTLTYPLIGNYGTYAEAAESLFPWAKAIIAHRVSDSPSRLQPHETVDQYLKHYHKPGLKDVDTRSLTRYLRAHGTSHAVLVPEGVAEEVWRPLLAGIDLSRSVYAVTTPQSYAVDGEGPRIALMDYGVKNSIVRELARRGAQVTVFPATTSAETVDALHPDGVVLSNGPGNPADFPELLPTVRHLVRHYPTMGICLGHQLIGLAEGAETYPLKFGHHGANHPLMDHRLNRVLITSQNHGYAVNPEKILDRYDIRLSNLHDSTVEGLIHHSLPVLSVQHHPEAGPGPKDSLYLFDEFMHWIQSEVEHA